MSVVATVATVAVAVAVFVIGWVLLPIIGAGLVRQLELVVGRVGIAVVVVVVAATALILVVAVVVLLCCYCCCCCNTFRN